MRSMSILLLQKIQMQSSNPRIVIAVLYGQNFEIKINSTSEGRHRLRAVPDKPVEKFVASEADGVGVRGAKRRGWQPAANNERKNIDSPPASPGLL